jgi:hypothetical protein
MLAIGRNKTTKTIKRPQQEKKKKNNKKTTTTNIK